MLDIIEKVEGPQGWLANAIATPKLNGKKMLCLDARTINKAIERGTFLTVICDFVMA